jgi:hypothetical protein
LLQHKNEDIFEHPPHFVLFAGTPTQIPILSGQQLLTPNVPLTQPLMINTGFTKSNSAAPVNNSTTVQFTTPGIIMSSTGVRMPVQVPIQVRLNVSSV